VLAAAGEVRLGRTVSLAAPAEHWVTPDNPDPCQHHMKEPLETDAGPGPSFSMDRIAMNIHGNADSHTDAQDDHTTSHGGGVVADMHGGEVTDPSVLAGLEHTFHQDPLQTQAAAYTGAPTGAAPTRVAAPTGRVQISQLSAACTARIARLISVQNERRFLYVMTSGLRYFQ
jgi:hypothetical protein